jgi:hypothetical protein
VKRKGKKKWNIFVQGPDIIEAVDATDTEAVFRVETNG